MTAIGRKRLNTKTDNPTQSDNPLRTALGNGGKDQLPFNGKKPSRTRLREGPPCAVTFGGQGKEKRDKENIKR